MEPRGDWSAYTCRDSGAPLKGSPDGTSKPGTNLAAGGRLYSERVISMIQLVSHVFPPSQEKACSHRQELGVMFDQT